MCLIFCVYISIPYLLDPKFVVNIFIERLQIRLKMNPCPFTTVSFMIQVEDRLNEHEERSLLWFLVRGVHPPTNQLLPLLRDFLSLLDSSVRVGVPPVVSDSF